MAAHTLAGNSAGFDRFVKTVELYASQASPGWEGTARFVSRMGADFAHIQPRDVLRPLRFLRQMAGNPPVRFEVAGFRPDLVDDLNPVRHYMAFLVVGFWLPALPALLVLAAWEVAGFVRYRGLWSNNDVRSGLVGLRHGRHVRRDGPWALPPLLRADLADRR